MYRRMLLVIVLILAAGTAWGQAPSTPSEGESTKELLERIEKLEKRVVELEAKAGTTAAALSTDPLPLSGNPRVWRRRFLRHKSEGVFEWIQSWPA